MKRSLPVYPALKRYRKAMEHRSRNSPSRVTLPQGRERGRGPGKGSGTDPFPGPFAASFPRPRVRFLVVSFFLEWQPKLEALLVPFPDLWASVRHGVSPGSARDLPEGTHLLFVSLSSHPP